MSVINEALPPALPPVPWLVSSLRSVRCASGPFDALLLSSRDAEAHNEDSGRKMETTVRTCAEKYGTSLSLAMYWRREKHATAFQHMILALESRD